MKKQLVFGLALVAVAASWGCNDDIKVEHRTFEQLCVNSGGTIDQDNNRVCKCGKGNNASSCAPGVVCINNGEYCADSSIVCSHNNVGFISCKEGGTPETLNVMSIQICQPIDGNSSSVDDSNYKYRPFTLTTEQMNEYKSEDLNGTCKCVDEGCTKTVSCSGNVCGECVNGDKKCDLIDNVNGIYYCDDGKWRQDKACVNNVSCNKDNDCGNCINGEQRCVVGSDGKNAEIQICKIGEWEKESDCSTVSCDTTGKQCGICHGVTTSCVDDANTGIGVYYECRENNWLNTICGGGASCKSDTECGECHDGDMKCEDGKLSTCENGQWGAEKTCENDYSCNAVATACGECVNGETKCDKGELSICINGSWLSSACPNNALCATETTCGVCHEGDKRCIAGTSNDGKASIDVCEKGAWNHLEDCETILCDATGKQCGICHGTSAECIDNEKTGVGIYYECKENTWLNSVCTNNVSCEKHPKLDDNDEVVQGEYISEKCGECHDGDTKCNDGKLSTCENGQWGAEKTCENDYSCNAVATACGECVNGSTKCENGIRSICVHGNWTNSATCSNNASCNSDNADCGECNNEDIKCDLYETGADESKTTKAILVKCVNGKWPAEVDIVKDNEINNESNYLVQECDVNICAANGKLCGTCEDKVTKCIMGSKYTCNAGTWGDAVACSGNASCKSTTECGDCINNDKHCVPGAEDSIKAYTETCYNGVWVKDVAGTCDSNKCDSTLKACEACADGKSECVTVEGEVISSTIRTCVGGKWEYMVCPSGECISQDNPNENSYCKDLETSSGETSIKCSEGDPTIICSLGKLYQCAAGKYIVHEPCSSGKCLNDQKCADSCDKENGKVISCNNDIKTKIGIKTICSDGLEKVVSCVDKSCNKIGDNCGEECINDYLKCHPSDKNKGYVCENGKWSTSETDLQVFFHTDHQIDNCKVLCPSNSGCSVDTYKSGLGITPP